MLQLYISHTNILHCCYLNCDNIFGYNNLDDLVSLIKKIEMAKNIERLDELTSFGLIYDEKLVCQYIHREINRGIFYGDNPFGATTSMLTVQILLMFILTRITHFLLSPCHQTYLVSQIVVSN